MEWKNSFLSNKIENAGTAVSDASDQTQETVTERPNRSLNQKYDDIGKAKFGVPENT